MEKGVFLDIRQYENINLLEFDLLSLLILNSMKFLRMTNRVQSLKQGNVKEQNEDKENIDPNQIPKLKTKAFSNEVAMVAEEGEYALRQEQIYEEEILAFLLGSVRNPPGNFNYFQSQPDITEHMRSVLMNWLVDVHLKYKLHPQTFFITANLIDSYLSANPVHRNELQLVGITALWIAAKYEETYQVPKIANLVYICDSTYSEAQILSMESKILLHIQFDFLKTTSFSFFQTLKRRTLLKDKDQFLAQYLLEALLFDVSSRKYSELTIAASVIFFIQKLRSYDLPKNKKMSEITGVSEKQLRACAREICSIWQKINEVNEMSSLRQKYMRGQFMQVAKIRLSEKSQKPGK